MSVKDKDLIHKERPITYGAVYFRRSAPPEHDWERDYERAAEDGITSFRHWFSWSAIEIAPGIYNWEPYDRQIELGLKYGIDAVIAEMSDHVPEWLYAKYPDLRHENIQGEKKFNTMNASCIVGGSRTLCFDNEVIRNETLRFLTAMGDHYKDMSGITGYDVWNECSMYKPDSLCFCPGTQSLFREWLKNKYQTLEKLNSAWMRFSYTDWEQVQIPRMIGPYPEFFDAMNFYNDTQERWFNLRVDTLRKADPNHKLISHGNGKAHSDMVNCCGDDWRYAKNVDIFGYTFWYANNCNTVMGGDIIRAASNGKEFWRAEALGDSNWDSRNDQIIPQVKMDEMSDPLQIRFDAMQSFIAGAKGFINPRYRGLLEGDLFHAFGWYAPDGSRTKRSEMASGIGKWANDPKVASLWNANPVKGQVALLMIPEAQTICYAIHKSTDIYASCLKGAFQAFYDSGIQADFIKIDALDNYDFVYLPNTLSMPDTYAEKISDWVKNGGTLVSEAAPGYFDDKAHAIEWQQPNRGLAEVFGCEQLSVHLGPDMNKMTDVITNNGVIHAGCYRQSYTPTTGKITGYHMDQTPALIENQFGNGRALLVGSMPGYGYFKRPDEATRRWFSSLLTFAGKMPDVCVPNNMGIAVRLWQNKDETYLWVLNTTSYDQTAEVIVRDDFVKVSAAQLFRGNRASFKNNRLFVEVEAYDASVIRIS